MDRLEEGGRRHSAAVSPSAGLPCCVVHCVNLTSFIQTCPLSSLSSASYAIEDPFRNSRESRSLCLPLVRSLSPCHNTHTQGHRREKHAKSTLPSEDGGRCVQAPPWFPKTHGMWLWSLCNVTQQHQWGDDASLLLSPLLSSPHHSVSFSFPLFPPPTLCSVCPPPPPSLLHLHLSDPLLQRGGGSEEAPLWQLLPGTTKGTMMSLLTLGVFNPNPNP